MFLSNDFLALSAGLIIVGLLALFALPFVIAMAILRYRLYDIDLLVSRSIAYAAVTGTLVVVYLLVNLGLTSAFSSLTRGDSVAVAASTLVVAALFTPIRRRIQRVVDRRFDRARYDADQTALAFSSRLRDEVGSSRRHRRPRGDDPPSGRTDVPVHLAQDPGGAPLMGIWVVRAFAVSALAAAAAVLIIQTARGWPFGPLGALAAGVNAAVAVTFTVVGWIVTERRRSNSIGPLLLAMGVLTAWFMPADLYLQLPDVLRQRPSPRLPAVLAATWIAIGTVIPAVLAYVILILFPDGRPPGPRWRWVIVAAFIAAVLGVAGIVLDPGPLPTKADYSSPWGVQGFSGRLLIVASEALTNGLKVAAVVALAVRWRRSGRVEHAQIKWVVATALVLIALTLASLDYDDPTADEFSWALGNRHQHQLGAGRRCHRHRDPALPLVRHRPDREPDDRVRGGHRRARSRLLRDRDLALVRPRVVRPG